MSVNGVVQFAAPDGRRWTELSSLSSVRRCRVTKRLYACTLEPSRECSFADLEVELVVRTCDGSVEGFELYYEDPQVSWTPDMLTLGRLEGCSIMGVTRRKFTLEFKTEAAHRVIDTGRSIAEVAG